ncbi:MAG: tRNA-2-methylthio-N6-dimethylallyladenosine synthase, partial [Marivirga sp.]
MSDLIQDLDIISKDTAADESCGVQISKEENTGKNRKLYIESYGCQMNFSDSEIVSSIMKDNGFDTTDDFRNADVIFLNTCSIREKAELTVRKRLTDFQKAKA